MGHSIMGWRTVVITKRAKLDLKMNYLVIRRDLNLERVYIDEIQVLMIASTAVSMTAALLNRLIQEKVKVIICDEKYNPSGEIMPLYGSHNTSLRCRQQIGWNKGLQKLIWTELLREKINNQRRLLKTQGKEEHKLLESYVNELLLNDESSREGHAAKVYFNALFGNLFCRDDDSNINAALDYGYAILLSAINREVVAMGYLTQFGIGHSNQFNPFNFSSDLIEPLRVLVDQIVVSMEHNNFTKEDKLSLVDLLNREVKIDGTVQHLSNAIRIYCKSICDALTENNIELIRLVEYEL